MRFALVLSRFTTPVILSLVYFLVFLPIGVLRRFTNRDPLVRPRAPSYWVPRAVGGTSRARMERQY
jgi:hypothetical protein